MDRETFLTLLTKKIAGELTEAEELRLIEATKTNEEYRQIENAILLQTPLLTIDLNPEKKLAAIIRSRIISYRYLSIAAACILIIVTGFGIFSGSRSATANKNMVT